MTTSPGGAVIELRPTVADKGNYIRTWYCAWTVIVNGVWLYQNVWNDEQIVEPALRATIAAAIEVFPQVALAAEQARAQADNDQSSRALRNL